MAIDFCDEVGDPTRFYFVFPAENDAGDFLDINEAVRRDGGKTSVCRLYLTHMIGPERANAMMADKKLRDKHLVILPVPNFQNKGLDTIVLRYSAIPALNRFQKSFSTTLFGEPLQQLDVVQELLTLMIGTVLAGLWGVNAISDGRQFMSTKNGTMLLIVALVFIGIPVARFMSSFKAASNDRDRLRELEAKRMGYTFQRWQEAKSKQSSPSGSSAESSTRSSPSSEKPRTSAAGVARTPKTTRAARAAQRLASERAYAIREREFRRLQAQSPEAIVAGGADPRTFRTERARLQKMERSSSRSASGKKSARAGRTRSRRRV